MRIVSTAFIAVLVAGPGAAAAGTSTIDFPSGTDFATCDPDMPVCDSRTNSCCVRPFSAVSSDRAVVIPLDRCHQTPTGSAFVAPGPEAPKWCSEPSPVQDDGAFIAYGLVYRLMQAGIPVYWLVNPTKAASPVSSTENVSSQTYTHRDIDFWILAWDGDQNRLAASPPAPGEPLASCTGNCEAPVVRLNPDLTPADAYDKAQFPVRGSAFVIAAEDRARFNELWTRTGEFADRAGDLRYDFSQVDLYEVSRNAELAWQDFRLAPARLIRGAPVAATLDWDPPRLAIQTGGVSDKWLAKTQLDTPAESGCTGGEWSPADAVYCPVTESDVANGVLINGGFEWAWFDNYKDNSPCGNANETAVVDGFHQFLTAEPGVRSAGSVLFMEGAIDTVEGCDGREFMGKAGIGLTGESPAMSEPFIYRYPSNLFMQFADYPASFAQGGPSKLRYFGNGAAGFAADHLGANGTLRRLVSEDAVTSDSAACVGHQSSPECDVFANDVDADTVDLAVYSRKDGDPRNGIVFYMAGNQVTQNNNAAHLRMLLNAFIATPSGGVDTDAEPELMVELSRSSPIISTIEGIRSYVQGTFESSAAVGSPTTFSSARDASTFEFPAILGHLRAFDVEVLGAATAFSALPALFNAADQIPPASPSGCGSAAFSGTCRTVFTHTESGTGPARVELSTQNRAALAPLLGGDLTTGEVDTLISRILAGQPDGSGGYQPALGGIDRSTVAVIEASATANPNRPKMIYAGGLDGMLHAFCAEIREPCQALGQELWAFIPRTQLPLLRFNAQRVDGSPRVSDILADFDDDGTAEVKTVLAFQTGSGDAAVAARAPATIALDITDPAAPQVLWERTTSAARAEAEPGVGLSLAMSLIKVEGRATHLTFATTNNGGTGAAGVLLEAIETATGEVRWSHFSPYPMPRHDSNPRLPGTGIPAGVTVVDMVGTGFATHLLLPTLYGDLWMFQATDGANPHGSKPLFRFSEDFHPIGVPATVFRDPESNDLHAVVVSGGYADPIGTSWSPDDVRQYAVAVALDTPASLSPIDETESFAGNRKWTIDLGVGQRAFSQAVVLGSEIFIGTMSRDANRLQLDGQTGIGLMRRFSVVDGRSTGGAITLGEGAGGADADGGELFTGGADGASRTQLENFADQGKVVEILKLAKSRRLVWLNLSQ